MQNAYARLLNEEAPDWVTEELLDATARGEGQENGDEEEGGLRNFLQEVDPDSDDEEGFVTIEEDGTGDLVTGYQDDMFLED